jgi:hypothetical protein
MKNNSIPTENTLASVQRCGSALRFSAAPAGFKSTRNTRFMIPLEETFPSGLLH